MRELTPIVCLSLTITVASCGGGQFSSKGGGAGGAGATPSGSGGREAGGSGGNAEAGGGAGGTDGTGASAGSGGSDSTGGGGGAGGTRPPPGSGGTEPSDAGSGGARPGSGGTEAGGTTARDASAPHWCDGRQALFCEDFDELSGVDKFLNSWTSFSTTGGTFSFDSGPGVPSSPNALRIRTTSPSDVDAIVVRAIPPFTKSPSKLRLEFDLRIDAGDNVALLSGAAFAGILTGNHVTDGVVGIDIGNGPALVAGYLERSGAVGAAPLTGPFPAENKWLGRYALEITYSAVTSATRAGCAQVYVNGVAGLAQCLKLPASLVDPPSISIALGVYGRALSVTGSGTSMTGDIQLRFDDVLLTAG